MNVRRFFGHFTAATSMLLLPFAVPVTLADSTNGKSSAELEEVVVTATKREERLQDVPIAITALSEKELRRRAAERIEDYVATVPGLNYASNGGNSGVLSIRGISTSTLAGNTQSPVALYHDDAPVLDTFAPLGVPDLRLFDVESVEVLRGPQGTLFGSGALGGAIRVQTRKPDLSAFGGVAQVHFADVDGGSSSYGASAALNLPLVQDQLAVRVVGNYRRDSGYVSNSRLGRSQANESTTTGGRVRVRWVPTEHLTVDASANLQKDDPNDAAYVTYGGRRFTGNAYVAQPTSNDTKSYQLAVRYEFTNLTLTSLTNYMDRTTRITRDFTPVIVGALGGLGISGTAPVNVVGPSRILSQELRLASKASQPLRWQVGLYYVDSKRGDEERLPVAGAGAILGPFGFPGDLLFTSSSMIQSTEKAAFGELAWDIAPKWTATAGLRYFRNEITFDGTADGIVNGGFSRTNRSTSESATTPKLALAYRPADNLNFYVQAAKGYRVGQNNLGPARDPSSGLAIPTNYGPDSLWNYETGMKGSFLDGRVFLDASVYWIQWRDIQLQANSASGFNYVDNIGEARSRGAELQLRARPTTGVEFGVTASLNDSEILSVSPNASARTGDRLPGAARVAHAEYVTWTFAPAVDGYLRLEHQYTGKAYSDLNNATALTFGDYHRTNLRAGFTWKGFEWMLSADNLANKYAYQSAVRLPIGPTAVPLMPRTLGLSVRTTF